ncbi:MAG: diadenylate cyclase CdaA [Candidatus Promineifilaceae bacterium]
MAELQEFIENVYYRIEGLDRLDALDLLLVTIAIYLLLLLIRRSQAAFVLRAVLVLAGLLLLGNLVLPLPTFGFIMTFAALAMVVTLPIVLQPELRRWLEQFGRRIGFSLGGREGLAGSVVPEITRAVDNLSHAKTGALIVLEGGMPLTEIISSGVTVDAAVSAELLQTIFFNKTPLHDGAVVIRGDELVAAGCVLPLSDKELRGWRRLGTRHRAALGQSEVSDSLTVVVSEETGAISVAQNGRLRHDLERTELYHALDDFYTSDASIGEGFNWRIWDGWHFPSLRNFLIDLFYLFLALMLAMLATTAVRASNDPTVTGREEGVTLNQVGLAEDVTLTSTVPRTVIVEYETRDSELPSIGTSTFDASISLNDVSSGTVRVPVVVTTTSESVRVLRAIPAEIDITAAAIVTATKPISVSVLDVDLLSTAYEIVGDPLVEPANSVVTGPEPDVSRVATLGATISVANATTSVSQSRPLVALDAQGGTVSAVTVDPATADVTVAIRRRINARDVGVRAVTTGSPPEGYWLSGLTVEPAGVTIQGNPSTIAEMGSFVDTTAVDLSEAVGELVVDVPLDLPGDVQAVGSAGEAISQVTVTAQVASRSGDLLVTRAVELVNNRSNLTAALDPQEVELLLSGPLPTLNEINGDPSLVRVLIDAAGLNPGDSEEITPQVIAPDGILAQLVETSVLVTVEPEPEPEAP